MRYEVTHDNVGTIHTGNNKRIALRQFNLAVQESKLETGSRGFCEDVTFWINGNPDVEYRAPKLHYHAINGVSGCIPGSNEVYESEIDAIDALAAMFSELLSEEEFVRLNEDLRECGYHSFDNPCEVGAQYPQYAQVTECEVSLLQCTDRAVL